MFISAVRDDAIPIAFLANGESYKEWHFISYFGYESSALTLNTKAMSPYRRKNCSNRERKIVKPGQKPYIDSYEGFK